MAAKRPTEDEVNLLKRYYTGDGERTIKLALRLNVGRRTVRRWAADLGLTKPHQKVAMTSAGHDVANTAEPVANIAEREKTTEPTFAIRFAQIGQTLDAWMASDVIRGQPPYDWGASRDAARIAIDCMRRYAFDLEGDLTDYEVRQDLLAVQQLTAFLLLIGERRSA